MSAPLPGQTPSQTVGPYFALGLTPGPYRIDFADVFAAQLVGADDPARIDIVGQVFDGNGAPITDAMLEIQQAAGFGRCGTGADSGGGFRFVTVKPEAPGQAPYIDVVVFMRGLLSHVFTRIYFADEAARNTTDPVLAAVPAERRDTLLARRLEHAHGVVYTFDIYMQGERETVFFDF